MSLNSGKMKGGNGGNRVHQKLIKRGAHMARIVQVIDIGVQKRKPWKGTEKKPVQMMRVTYEFPKVLMMDEDGKPIKDKPRWLTEKMPLYPLKVENAKSTLRMSVIDPEGELEGDWTQVGNLPVMVTITHSKDGKYSNIGSVSEMMEGMDVPELQNPVKIFTMDEPDLEAYNSLPEFIQEEITSSLDFNGSALEKLLNGDAEEVVKEEPEEEEYEVDDDVPY